MDRTEVNLSADDKGFSSSMKIQKYDVSVTEVDTDLYQIVLPQPFYDNNCVYCVKDDEPTLIDTGYVESMGHLSASLKYLGLRLNKIQNIIYTHNHIDHISGGLLFPVYAKNVRRFGFHKLDMVDDFLLYFHAWIHENERVMRLAVQDAQERQERGEKIRSYWYGFLERFETKDKKRGERFIELTRGLKEGDVVKTGKYSFQIMETPGHNKWHITPIEKSRKWLFSGDLIIGNIPAIYNQLDGNLLDYYHTMHRLLGGYGHFRFFPGHGNIIENPDKRIRVILRTLEMMERNVLKKLTHKPTGIMALVKQMMGNSIESDNHFLVAIALLESILRKLMKEKKVISNLYYNGYEEFMLMS